MIGPSDDGPPGRGGVAAVRAPAVFQDPHAVDGGLIPRSCAYILDQIAQSGAGCTIRASFLEIYKEQVYDLLNPGNTLNVRWGSSQGFFVVGLLWAQCDSVEDLMAVVSEGVRNRSVGSHELNADSSRSHSILTLELNVEDSMHGGVRVKRTGRVSLVDLAGASPPPLTEISWLNTSLMPRE